MNFDEDYLSLPTSRKKALKLGEDFYYTGKPCKRGHINKRRSSNRNCLDCEKMYDGSRKEYFSQHASENKERRKENSKRSNQKQASIRAAQREKDYWDSVPKELWSSVVSKEDAISKGLKRYFTGLPCKYGHVVERLVSSRSCVECSANREQEYNPEKERARAKLRYKNNKKAINTYRNEYFKKRLKTDKNFRALKSCRSILRRTLLLSGTEKEKRTNELLGYSAETLCSDMESKFLEDMSWDNYGEVWHIDHIIPITRYTAMGVTSPDIINHLDNLIPMYSDHNLKKSSKTLSEFIEEFPDLNPLYGKFIGGEDHGRL